MRIVRLLPALVVTVLPSCGSSLSPECAALARCCDAQNDTNCRRSAEESDKREGGEQACAAARSVFLQAMICEDEEVEGGVNPMDVKSCEDLVAVLSSAPEPGRALRRRANSKRDRTQRWTVRPPFLHS